MSNLRGWVLVVGPLPIVLGAMTVSHLARPDVAPLRDRNEVLVAERAVDPAVGDSRAQAADDASADLRTACDRAGARLESQLAADCSLLVRPPFVIAGDLPREELDGWYQRTIGPASRALAASYFEAAPDAPITVLLFASEASYERHARSFIDTQGASIYGYYRPAQRMLVMNLATGSGTLVHELTHALMDFDFPRAPHWFNEGLASLHEQCRIHDDESGLEGLPNWRLPILVQAIRQDRLQPLAQWMAGDEFRGHNVSLNYAQARYLCLYLQQRGRLAEFYRRFRATVANDPSGALTLRAVLSAESCEAIDAEFRRWVLELEAAASSTRARDDAGPALGAQSG